ncbi:mechanosensitive ion channel [Candidatus Pacearchaeota archaeon]|nr:mechanosensitive ion channel [Candidatus Pacearchaeota archaeon]
METLNFSLFSFDFNGIIPFLEVLAIALILIILFNLILLFVKRSLLKRAKSKNQISNIKILSRIINIVVVILIIILSFFSYVRSWTGIGVVLGLLTAALGFALQKPITGVAAWLMVVLKRPFRVGDRITIGGVKGDVYDISLTHLYIDEVGGGKIDWRVYSIYR